MAELEEISVQTAAEVVTQPSLSIAAASSAPVAASSAPVAASSAPVADSSAPAVGLGCSGTGGVRLTFYTL